MDIRDGDSKEDSADGSVVLVSKAAPGGVSMGSGDEITEWAAVLGIGIGGGGRESGGSTVTIGNVVPVSPSEDCAGS